MSSIFGPKISSFRGMTWLEVVLIIGIICTLAFVVVAALNVAKSKGRDAERVADVKALQLALGLYFDANTVFPTSLGTNKESPLVTGGYIASIPTDPASGASYAYTPYAVSGYEDICVGYHLGASLEDARQTILRGDKDVTIGSTAHEGETVPDGVVVCTTSSQSDFHGSDREKCRESDIGNACYDVTP